MDRLLRLGGGMPGLGQVGLGLSERGLPAVVFSSRWTTTYE